MSVNPFQQLQRPKSLQGSQPPMPRQVQPGADPRLQAIQQYMQMQGAQQPPNLPRQMPNGQGGTRPINMLDEQQMTDQMQEGSDQAYSNDTNAYWRDKSNQDTDLIDQEQSADDQMQDELNTEEDRVPTYVDNKGQPSPNKQYSDEDMLQGVSNRINRAEFTGDLERDKRMLIADPSDTNVEEFVAMHGEENLPDDLQEPDVSDPSGNR